MASGLVLRRVGLDDYDVAHDGEIIGRIYRMSGDEEVWRWMMLGSREPRDGPSGGLSYTFEEAKAAFRRAWDTAPQEHGSK